MSLVRYIDFQKNELKERRELNRIPEAKKFCHKSRREDLEIPEHSASYVRIFQTASNEELRQKIEPSKGRGGVGLPQYTDLSLPQRYF